jgi:hypothetical protein
MVTDTWIFPSLATTHDAIGKREKMGSWAVRQIVPLDGGLFIVIFERVEEMSDDVR